MKAKDTLLFSYVAVIAAIVIVTSPIWAPMLFIGYTIHAVHQIVTGR